MIKVVEVFGRHLLKILLKTARVASCDFLHSVAGSKIMFIYNSTVGAYNLLHLLLPLMFSRVYTLQTKQQMTTESGKKNWKTFVISALPVTTLKFQRFQLNMLKEQTVVLK